MRRRARIAVGAGAAVGLLAVSQSCLPDPRTTREDCLAQTTVVVADQPLPYWPRHTDPRTFDATGSTFDTDTGYVKFKAGISEAEACWIGGTFGSAALDPQTTPWTEWHAAGADFYISKEDVTVVGAMFTNSGDAIATNGDNWSIDETRVDGIVHDDCAQNDLGKSGKIADSLFDGCQVFMSSRGLVMDGTAQTVTVDGVLVRSVPFANSYRPPNTSGGWFKWSNNPASDGIPPHLVVRDSVFRADERGAHGGTTWTVNGTKVNAINGLPPGSECSGVTLIVGDWWDDFADRDGASWIEQCSGLTVLDVDDGGAEFWDDAATTWEADHD